MYTRVLEYFNEFKLFYEKQFGFRGNHSAYMALMVLMDKMLKSLENGEFVIGIFLDFSKAFDTVNHQILLKKLE